MAFQRATRRRAAAAATQKRDTGSPSLSPSPFTPSKAALPRFSIASLPILPPGQGVAQLANGDDEDDGRSLKELQEDLERLSRKPRREKIVSEQKKPKKKVRLPRGEAGWKNRQPVIGHEPAPLEEPDGRQSKAVRAVGQAIAELSETRSSAKADTTAEVYRARKPFPKDATRSQIRGLAGGAAFLDHHFGEAGSYVPDLQSADVTSRKVLDKANEKLAKYLGGAKPAKPMKLKAHNVATTGETRITHGGVHLYTLHRGSTAFRSAGRARDSGREVLAKKGSSKQYVRDDRGVPTHRFAYAIKGEGQIAHIAQGGTLRGRFTLPTHPTFGRAPRTIMSGSHTEIAELGRVPPQAQRTAGGGMRNRFGELTPDEMLYMHQEFGSDQRQRGVSIAGSATPLLSNEARGFADNPGARKLRIDLSTVPRAGRKGAPNLVNFHQRIRGMEHKRVVAPALYAATGVPAPMTPQAYDDAALAGAIQPGALKYDQPRQQRRFDWSVAKNRELFLASLGKRNLKGSVPVSRLERTDIPDAGIEEELNRVKAEAREGEAAIPRIRTRKQKRQTRKRRKGPKGRNT